MNCLNCHALAENYKGANLNKGRKNRINII